MKKFGLIAPLSAALCLTVGGLTVGCGEAHMGDEDAAITFDATFEPDAGPPPSPVGDECGTDAECDIEGGYCDGEFPGGYCTAGCGPDLPCPTGGTCIETRTGAFCLEECDLDAADGDFCARDSYGCADELNVCLPGCDIDSECATDRVCDAAGSFNGEGRCADPSAEIGDACADSEECGPGTFCLSERFSGIPGGVCGAFGCDPTTNTGCPEGGVCLPAGRGGVCLRACADDTGCPRADQECAPTTDGGVCWPRFVDENLGAICSADRGPCTGGECLTEGGSGYPDSYCAASDCDVAAQTGCPTAGVCAPRDGAPPVCLLGCTVDTDCRDGYDCAASDPGDPASPLACVPGCDADADCGNPDFACNPGTGLCAMPFVDASLGEPCAAAEDCVGGRCLAEATDGWPAGTCVYPGCRLSGTGPEATCPSGSACVDDGAGDPELGICAADCTMTTECRPAYACTDGACQPACTADTDCGSGRTCTTATGLCE